MSSLLVSLSAFDADPILNLDAARARSGDRYPEFRNKALAYFRRKGLSSDGWQEAAANAILLAWHYVVGLVRRCACSDRKMTLSASEQMREEPLDELTLPRRPDLIR